MRSIFFSLLEEACKKYTPLTDEKLPQVDLKHNQFEAIIFNNKKVWNLKNYILIYIKILQQFFIS